MKPINIDAWLVNFMLPYTGLSPLLIGPKVNFFQINVTQKATIMCAPVGLDQPKPVHPNQISSKKLQLGKTKSFWSYMNNASLTEHFWAQPNYRRACHIGCHIRLCPAWQNCRNEVMTLCIDDFPRVINLMTLWNKVSSLIVVCDAYLMTERFCNNRHR
jgi:hypothetical protein